MAFFVVQMAVFGLCLGGSFAPSHKGMPIVPPTAKIDFFRRQVLMSRNVRGGLLVDFVMGGLNYQIEHHLFPSMPRPNLKLVRPLIRDYCAQHGVPYTEVGLFESYGIVVSYLNNVGLQARGPVRVPDHGAVPHLSGCRRQRSALRLADCTGAPEPVRRGIARGRPVRSLWVHVVVRGGQRRSPACRAHPRSRRFSGDPARR